MPSTKALVPYLLSEEAAEPLEPRDRFEIGGLSALIIAGVLLPTAAAFADAISGLSAGGMITGLLLVALLFDPSIRSSLKERRTWDDVLDFVARLTRPRSDSVDD